MGPSETSSPSNYRPKSASNQNCEWGEWKASAQICSQGNLSIVRECKNKLTGQVVDDSNCNGISKRTESCSIENMKSFSPNEFVHNQQPNRHGMTASDYQSMEMDFDNDMHVDFQPKQASQYQGTTGFTVRGSNSNKHSRGRREITQGVNPDRYKNFAKSDIGYVSKNGFSYAEPLGNRESFDEKITEDTYRTDNKAALEIKEGTEEACCKELYTCGDAATFYKSGKYQFLGLNKEDKAIYTKNNKHYISAMPWGVVSA